MKQNIQNFVLRGEMPSHTEIMDRLSIEGHHPKKLVITPLIDVTQVEDGTIDLRLGTEFVVAKRSKYESLDPLKDVDIMETKILEYQEKTYINIGDRLILHPHQFALGATFEYIKMPVDLVGYVLGRSSWGRLGLVIATATVIHPKYAGIITLELTNLGDTPITLYPGTRIAQLALHKISMTRRQENKAYKDLKSQESKYTASVSPVFTRVYKDKDFPMIAKLKDKEFWK